MASGDSLLILRPGNGTPTATASAGLTSIAGASSPAERFTVLAFDDGATLEHFDFPLIMPQSFAGTTGITLRFMHGSAAATGNYLLGAALRRIEDDTDDLDTTAHTYVYQETSAVTTPSAIGEVAYDSLALTNAQMDGVIAGDAFILRIRVDGDTTITGDTYIYQIEVRET